MSGGYQQRPMEQRGPVAGSTSRLGPALEDLVDEGVLRMRLGLMAVGDVHGLTRTELVATHRAVHHLSRSGLAPPAEVFWATTALPRADRWRREATAVVDAELDRLLARVAGVRGSGPRPGGAAEGWDAELADRLGEALVDDGELDLLGRFWLRRLRRAALVQALPRILREPPVAARRLVADTEMELLESAPWSHGDRLLSAFELARSEHRRQGRDRIAQTVEHLLLVGGPPLVRLPS